MAKLIVVLFDAIDAGNPCKKEKREENQGRNGELIIDPMSAAVEPEPFFFIVQSLLAGLLRFNKAAAGQKSRYVAPWCHKSLLLRARRRICSSATGRNDIEHPEEH